MAMALQPNGEQSSFSGNRIGTTIFMDTFSHGCCIWQGPVSYALNYCL